MKWKTSLKDVVYLVIIIIIFFYTLIIIDENINLEKELIISNTNITLLSEQLNNKYLKLYQKDKECEIKLLNQSLKYENTIYQMNYEFLKYKEK